MAVPVDNYWYLVSIWRYRLVLGGSGSVLGAALFSRIFAINSSDQKKILARLKKMVLEHSQKIGATRQPFLGQLLLFLPTARR